MDGRDFLKQSKYATEPVIDLIWGEKELLNNLQRDLTRLIAEAENGYRRAAPNPADTPFDPDFDGPDDVMARTGIYWDTYFGADRESYIVTEEIVKLDQSVELKKFSTQLLSSALLQIAKQGMSIVCKGFDNSNDGRMIESLSVKNIVWQGRNQAMHYNEVKPLHLPVTECFNTLVKEHEGKFDNYQNDPKSFEIVDLLQWNSWESFENDMILLLGVQ